MKKFVEKVLMAVTLMITMTTTAFAEASPYTANVPESSPEFIWTNRMILLGIAVVVLAIAFFASRSGKKAEVKAAKAERVSSSMDTARA